MILTNLAKTVSHMIYLVKIIEEEVSNTGHKMNDAGHRMGDKEYRLFEI